VTLLHTVARLALLACVLVASGCSSYEAKSPYGSLPGESTQFSPELGAPHVTFRALDLPTFGSFGPPGVPFIPIHVWFTGPTELELDFAVSIPPARDFSAAWRPCLSGDVGRRVCASSAELWWTGRGRPALVLRSEWRREFEGLEEPSPARLTRQATYERADYRGDPPLEDFSLLGTYRFRCEGRCPDHLRLDAKELFESEGVSVSPGRLEFHRVSTAAYHPFFWPWPLPHG
jgi:hypothetical protein